jgi:hypothetical protein
LEGGGRWLKVSVPVPGLGVLELGAVVMVAVVKGHVSLVVVVLRGLSPPAGGTRGRHVTL